MDSRARPRSPPACPSPSPCPGPDAGTLGPGRAVLTEPPVNPGGPPVPAFDRAFFSKPATPSRIGLGDLGGKGSGLVRAASIVRLLGPRDWSATVEATVPRLTILGVGVFDAFVEQNGLGHLRDDEGLSDEHVAQAFRTANLPAEILGDLRALVQEARQPLAVRSSSLLEDSLAIPFAGVYATKMTPNNQPDADTRFRKLVEAIKLVYASVFFREARDYARAAGAPAGDRMAVVVQEIVGERHGERFYPSVSGVARSFNFYPSGDARPEEGVVNLALGLGKTIVDGGRSWSYSPRFPRRPPPFASARDLLDSTQSRFWAVNMGRPPAWDPMSETEYLFEHDLATAESDGVLDRLASTYDAAADRFRPGTGGSGARAVDFAPLLSLREPPLADAIADLLAASERELGGPVEIEIAATLEAGPPVTARLGFLQVRPMAVATTTVDLDAAELDRATALVASEQAMGNGVEEGIADVVYVRPEAFAAADTRRIAEEIGELNRRLVAERRPYLLIGFGRWGSSDPWLGIPVDWSQVSGARAIVEATLPQMNVDPSQGSHFFHNLSSFRVSYLMVHHRLGRPIDWAWLDARPATGETERVRHVRLERPLTIRVDGRRARGVVDRPEGE